MQEIEILPYEEVVHVPRIRLWQWNSKPPLGFWDTNRIPNLGQTTKPGDSQQKKKVKKKRTCHIVDFAVLADHNKIKRTWTVG